MSDRQFDAYLKRILRELRRAEGEIDGLSGGKVKSKILAEIVSDIDEHLKRP